MDGPVSERRLPIATLGSTLPAIAWATLSRQPKAPVHNVFAAWSEYWVDAVQRSVLFLDVLRQRGNTAVELATHDSPNVLGFATELVLDGRSFERPVNYLLHAIVPPEGIAVDLKARPFIVFDPRAGHGPGIGGMRLGSEIGAALRAGNPCYFVGFRPKPDRRRLPSRGGVHPRSDTSASRGASRTGADRQLPSRLAVDDDGGNEP